jgi:hypothetical protein
MPMILFLLAWAKTLPLRCQASPVESGKPTRMPQHMLGESENAARVEIVAGRRAD